MTEPEEPHDEAWSRIATLQDPIQARALRELLENEGIPCATPGAEHRAALGFIGAYVSIPVQVPKAHARKAKRIYDAFVRPGLDSRVPSADTSAETEPSGPTRMKRVAVFVAIWAPIGAGHLYAREGYSALVLLMAQASAMISVCAGGPPSLALGAGLVWLYDIVGSTFAVDRFNRGSPRGPTESVLVTAFAVLALQLVAMPITTMVARYAPPPTRELFPAQYGHEGGTGSPTGLPITQPF